MRKSNVKAKTWKNYTLYMERAIEAWGDRNLKGIRRGDIQDLIDSYDIGEKSKANMVSCLSAFWKWLLASETVRPQDVPQFPQVKFKLGSRKTVNKEMQTAILNELHRQTYEKNPKVWLGVKWLSTYVCLRPGDLFRIRERDIDRRNRVVFIRDPKAAEPYELPLTTQDVEALLRIAPGAPEEPFFRHTAGVSGVAEGEPFGERYFYKHWKKACDSLGIEGVDLYGGTRHSSARAMRRTHSPEQIRWATMHRTSKAFERYFQMNEEDLREMYEQAEICTTFVPTFSGSSKT